MLYEVITPITYKLKASNGSVLGFDRISSTSSSDMFNAITYDPVTGSIYVVGDYSDDFAGNTNSGQSDARNNFV